MPEWWTYSLSDFLMFSARTYYRLFELHNRQLWPAHVAALLAGLVILSGPLRPARWSARLVCVLLAAGWLVVAWTYLREKYSTIHWAGRYLAALFVLQGLGLLWSGAARSRLLFVPGGDFIGRVGTAILAFAVLIEPLAGRMAGRPWSQAEVFGLTPDPTVTATLGMLLAARQPGWWLWIIPLAWGLFSGMTLWTMDAPEAFMVLALAGLGGTLAVVKARIQIAGAKKGGGV